MNPEVLTLRRDSTTLKTVLIEGALQVDGQYRRAFPREVITGQSGEEWVVFETVSFKPPTRISQFNAILSAIRLETLVTLFLLVAEVVLWGIEKTWPIQPWIGFCAFFGAILLQIAVNLLNDVDDYLGLIDLIGNQSGSRVLQRGIFSLKQIQRAGQVSLVLGILLGMPAVWFHPELLLLGIAGVIGVLTYSGRILGLKFQLVGDFAVFILLGPLLALGSSIAFFGFWDIGTIAIGSITGILAYAMVHANNLQNMDVDRSRGIRNLAIVLGYSWARHVFVGFYLSVYVLLIVGLMLNVLPGVCLWISLGTIPVLLKVSILLYQASGPASALLTSFRAQVIQLNLFMSGLIALGFLLHFIKS